MFKMGNKKKIILILVLGIAVILLGGYLVLQQFVMNRSVLEDPTVSVVSQFDEYTTPSAIQDKTVTFLILGVSNDDEERPDDNMTDTMMLVTLDVPNCKASVLQIPRDTFIGNETANGKINAVYGQDKSYWDYNGINGLKKMLYETLQIRIDHYATIQMDGFRTMIDAIGGVTMDVPVDIELNGTEVSKGLQTLDGEQAIAVVRARYSYASGDDLTRLNTQKLFLTGLMEQCQDLSVKDMAGLLPTVMNSVTTDLTPNEVLEYYKLAKLLEADDVHVAVLPGMGLDHYFQDKQGNRHTVYGLYPEATAELLNEYFRPYADPVGAEDLGIVETPAAEQEQEELKNRQDQSNSEDSETDREQTEPADESSSDRQSSRNASTAIS